MKTSNIGKAEFLSEFCVSNLYRLHTFDNIALAVSQKRVKNQKSSLWVHETLILKLYDPCWEVIQCNKWQWGTSQISTPPEIAVVAYFGARHGAKITSVFLLVDGEACWLLSFVSLLQANRKHVVLYPEKAKKSISIKIDHNYHQHLSS